jgi:hypothetical protein
MVSKNLALFAVQMIKQLRDQCSHCQRLSEAHVSEFFFTATRGERRCFLSTDLMGVSQFVAFLHRESLSYFTQREQGEGNGKRTHVVCGFAKLVDRPAN